MGRFNARLCYQHHKAPLPNYTNRTVISYTPRWDCWFGNPKIYYISDNKVEFSMINKEKSSLFRHN